MNTSEIANYIRVKALEMCSRGKSSHVGSVLSCADILAFIYGHAINVSASAPSSSQYDRFVMSKGHAGAGLYATLAYLGFVDEEILKTHYEDGSYLSGHVCHKIFPGIDISTGSLGHGLPIGAGFALGQRLLRRPGLKTFVLMSDGELDEGSNWEAFLFGGHHRLSNMHVYIDRNKLQSIGSTESTLGLEPLSEKLKAFGWDVYEVDGHCQREMETAYGEAKLIDMPHVYICNTTKGKGVSFMENEVLWHYRSPTEEELLLGLDELR